MRFLVGICLIAGCQPPIPPAAAPPPRAPAMFELPRAPYDVVPADLSDPGVVTKIPHRAIMRTWNRAALVLDRGEVLVRENREDAHVALPVLGESARAVRVVIEDDGARVAAWVPRGDVAETVVVPVQLADERGSGVGVWIEPGIELVTQRDGVARQVAIVDHAMSASGWAPKHAIDQVWIAKQGTVPLAKYGRRTEWRPPSDRREKRLLAPNAEIRAQWDARSPVIATAHTDDQIAAVVRYHEHAVVEIEVARPQLRVRGYVTGAQLLPVPDGLGVHTTGGGHGFGMSNATKHQVPATTCLYASPNGDIVGATIASQERLGGPVSSDVWVQIYVDTPWAIAPLWMKNQATPGLPPEWESCTDPALRR